MVNGLRNAATNSGDNYYLGVIIDENLNWAEQVTETSKMVFANFNSLKRYALCLPLNIKMLLIKALDFSHFSYCD